MIPILSIILGGFIGAVGRFTISNVFKNRSKLIPIGTLTVNLIGAFLLGILIGKGFKDNLYLLFGVGFMGAFTTFSTLKVEMLQMIENKKFKALFSYLLITYFGGIILSFLGMHLSR